MSPTPKWLEYKTEMRTVGPLAPKLVEVAIMPRNDFMAYVEETIEKVDLPPAPAAEIRGIARSMSTFPRTMWMTRRGCGCVIGEYLIAHDAIERGDVHILARRVLMEVDPANADLLYKFGNDLDERIDGALGDCSVGTVAIVDDVRA